MLSYFRTALIDHQLVVYPVAIEETTVVIECTAELLFPC